MWARVSGGVIVETTGTDPVGRYHPALVWVRVPALAKQGDAVTG